MEKVKRILSYSTRAVHEARRQKATDQSIIMFNKICKYVFSHESDDHIANSDESLYRCNPMNNRTWAKTGATGIRINITADDKKGFTFQIHMDLMTAQNPQVLQRH